jgi:very-short-patch-repair endonuclease
MHHKLNYNEYLKPFARTLRTEGTKGEAMLWFFALKARKMYGYQFNRQCPIGDYIVDFICRKLNLIVEIDGNSHFSMSESDRKRQDHLEGLGYQVLRFSEAEVVHRLDDVIGTISYAVETLEHNNKTSLS